MRYETVKALKDEDFKRSTGVSRKMFEKMLAVLQKEIRDFGRPPKLGRADQLLMTLMYWREYRTEFHKRYRNRRKRFSLRFNLIAAIYNLELKYAH